MDATRNKSFQPRPGNLPGQILNILQYYVPMLAIFVPVLAALAYMRESHPWLVTVGIAILLAPLVIAARYRQVVRANKYKPGRKRVPHRGPHYTLWVCGSGGHTTEMLRMVERSFQAHDNAHRRWAIGEGDTLSRERVWQLETRLRSVWGARSGTFDVVEFKRARYVHQSWLTTPWTVLRSVLSVFRALLLVPAPEHMLPACPYPLVVTTNGPGSGLVFLLAARAIKVCRFLLLRGGGGDPRALRGLFVESWARVSSLSLTGKLVYWSAAADLFIVQWEDLKRYGVFVEHFVALPRQPTAPGVVRERGRGKKKKENVVVEEMDGDWWDRTKGDEGAGDEEGNVLLKK
ncbi:oligosaccharide biosynthesis protein Alg14 like-domain-containing protein [Xylariomycetidae sp. FL2044]|nr:oligosaccharide biosynthesis protein Alg14 like-domain-containing protein [Xylariomycetidae sp. FL2044]